MISKTDVRNWIKLHLLLDCAAISFRGLFAKVWKDKHGRDWTKDDSKLIFANKQFKKMQKIQRGMVEDGDIDKWDISLLQDLLTAKNFLNLPSHYTTRLAQIRGIRNEIAHHATKIIPDDEFDNKWDELTNILVDFGESNAKLEQLKNVSRVGGLEFMPGNEDIDEESIVKVEQLKAKGNEELSSGKYLEAIGTFTKGIVLPKLPATDQAILHWSRCKARLKMYKKKVAKDEFEEFYELNTASKLIEAKQDAKKVLQLWPDWWRGYFCLGKVYIAMEKFLKAQNLLNAALAKEPQKQEVIDVLRDVSEKLGLNGTLHVDVESIARSKAEFVPDFGVETTLNVDAVILKSVQANCLNCDVIELESYRHCRRGHQNRYGLDGMPRDYRLAAQYYRKAADRKNAEGRFHLGQMILNGDGVKKSTGMGLKLVMEVAREPAKIEHVPNLGVAEALFLLGQCYEEGNGVVLNLDKAKDFYQQSSDHGCRKASNNLGLMYEYGIPDKIPDLDKAERLYRIAADDELLPDTNAMLNLARLCEQRGLYEKALIWCARAKLAGNRLPLLQKMMERLQNKHKECSGIIKDLETANGASALDTKENCLSEMNSLCHHISFRVQSKFNSILLEDCPLTSTYGKCLKEAKQHLLAANEVLLKEIGSVKIPSIALVEKFTKHFSKGAKIEFRVCELPAPQHQQAKSIIHEVLKQKAPFDEDARVCCVSLERLKPTCLDLITFLDECVLKYPKNSFFRRHRAHLRVLQYSYRNAVCDINAAKRLEPHNVDILCERAAAMRVAVPSIKLQAAIDAHKEFLSQAPDDHPGVPDAYFGIAQLGFMALDVCSSIKSSDAYIRNKFVDCWAEAKKNYELGLSAEKQQLCFFVPFKSSTKAVTEYILAMTLGLGTSSLLSASTVETTVVKTDVSSGPELNPKLSDSNRIAQITQHRAWLRDCRKNVASTSDYFTFAHQLPRQPKKPLCLIDLKAISLCNMSTAEDVVYEKHTLAVTIIDEVGFTRRSVVLLIEDNDGNVERCLLLNWLTVQDVSVVQEQFAPGRKFSIINPSVRLTSDGKRVVCVEDANTVIRQAVITNMCRYCCKSNADKSCTKCKKACYCDRTCQISDWNDMKHKLICRPNRN